MRRHNQHRTNPLHLQSFSLVDTPLATPPHARDRLLILVAHLSTPLHTHTFDSIHLYTFLHCLVIADDNPFCVVEKSGPSVFAGPHKTWSTIEKAIPVPKHECARKNTTITLRRHTFLVYRVFCILVVACIYVVGCARLSRFLLSVSSFRSFSFVGLRRSALIGLSKSA